MERWQSLIEQGDLDGVRASMLETPALLKSQDEDARGPLHWSISATGQNKKGVEVVETILDGLLAAHLEIDPVDDAGWTPLLMAVSMGKPHLVELLLDAGADASHQNENKQTVWHYAASKGHLDVLHLLVESIKKQKPQTLFSTLASQADKYGATPLHRAASQGHLPVVRYLVQTLNVPLQKADADGNTPAHLAAEDHHVDILYFLMDHVYSTASPTGASEADRKAQIQTFFWETKNKEDASVFSILGGRSMTKEEKSKYQQALTQYRDQLFEE